jgi:uncharacterized protein (DUF1697 family)
VFYLYAPEGIGRSKLAEKLGKAFPGTSMTGRNLNTINKLLEMIGRIDLSARPSNPWIHYDPTG